MYIDSHCHIHLPQLRDKIPELIKRMTASHISHALCVSLSLEDFPLLLTLIECYHNIYASVGVHPNYNGAFELTETQLGDLAVHPRVIAIGETGLDYYNCKNDPILQQKRFRTHIRVSKAVNKPLIIHTRLAGEDTLRILVEEGNINGVIHCFNESQKIADNAIKLGLYLSFSGIVTFKNAMLVQTIARSIPIERMLIETDSPYLAPVPYRGQVNEPSLVKYVGDFIGNLRNMSSVEIGKFTSKNFFNLFKI